MQGKFLNIEAHCAYSYFGLRAGCRFFFIHKRLEEHYFLSKCALKFTVTFSHSHGAGSTLLKLLICIFYCQLFDARYNTLNTVDCDLWEAILARETGVVLL